MAARFCINTLQLSAVAGQIVCDGKGPLTRFAGMGPSWGLQETSVSCSASQHVPDHWATMVVTSSNGPTSVDMLGLGAGLGT